VVNNKTPDLEPGHFWRLTLAVANRAPVKTTIKLPEKYGAVYDVFEQRRIEAKDGKIDVDLASMPFRLFALMPEAISELSVVCPAKVQAGQRMTWEVRAFTRKDGFGEKLPLKTPIPVRVSLTAVHANHMEVLSETVVVTIDGKATVSLDIPL